MLFQLIHLFTRIKFKVPTPPGKSWEFLNFFLKIPGPGKSWKNILENYAFLLVLMENKQK